MKNICFENSLLFKNPELCKEWNYSKNEFGPEKYTLCSGFRVWWKCLICNFEWKASICDRSYGTGCPNCRNKVINEFNNLLVKNPELCEEWNYIKNSFGPECYFPNSNKKVWWICSKCSFEWETRIGQRNKENGTNCPRCHNLYIDETNCLLTKNPELCKEWNFEKNELGPEKYAPKSYKRVWWVCLKCNFEWKTSIAHRNKDKSGCPRCINQYIDETNCLLTKNPELCKEWNFEKNELGPEKYAPVSKASVWWKCSKCNFEWENYIYNRSVGVGCPRCAGKYVDETNCLLTLKPELCKDWDYSKNVLGPDKYSLHSNKKVWWKCSKCNFEWNTGINHRTSCNITGCPKCNSKYSKKCNNWIDSFNNPNILKGQKIKINGFKRMAEVDGVDYNTNTIYEFYGTLFHGSPELCDSNDLSPVTHKTYRELYEKTIKREELIKADGYGLVVMWENEWDKQNKH